MNEFIFVRHGETQNNKEGILQGHLDDPLNEKGLKDAMKLAEHLRKINFHSIFSSDLTRAVQCAEEIQKYFPHLKIKKDGLLRERNFGAHQQKELVKDLGYKDNSYNSMVKHLYECKCPDGETNEQLLGRIKKFLLTVNKMENKMVLVVTHGGVVMLLLNYLLKEEIKFENSRQHKNGYVSYMRLDDDLEMIDSLINVHVSGIANYLKNK